MNQPQRGRSRTSDVELTGEPVRGEEALFTAGALELLVALERRFRSTREFLLRRRATLQLQLDSGWRPDFLEETRDVREGDWKVARVPRELLDRRVEITGPVDRKMIINALNSGANVFMADFEDSTSPTWENMVRGQLNLRDAVRHTIDYVDPKKNKVYRLADRTAVLFVRPRGWHLLEERVLVDGKPCSASIFDFAIFLFHNARELIRRGSGPYFYLPKIESHLEARLWNEVFVFAQDALGIPLGTVKATVLIETLLAAFEMDEILFELRDHSAGLNCGRWDYIFSFIKKLRSDPTCVLPDRHAVGMDRHFLRSYSHLLVQTCHRRNAHAMGGMAAQIPLMDDPEANARAMDAVRADKRREARAGHDGTWVAHPALVEIVREEFDELMPAANQRYRLRNDVTVTADDLLRVPAGAITEGGLRTNLNVGVRYLAAWLDGTGCVPIFGLMEDAATAEISRTQVWQWLYHGAQLEDGRTITEELVRAMLAEELDAIRTDVGDVRWTSGRYEAAARLFESMITAVEPAEFLTLEASRQL